MPVYLDETTTDETNPHIIDFAVFSDEAIASPDHNIVFKLKPIHIVFRDFEKLFFKKRKTLYTVARLCFLNELFNKIKPKLVRLLQDTHSESNKTSILIGRELFNMVLESRIKSRVALSHSNFVSSIDTTNDTYVRITLSLGIHAISTTMCIEFMFKVRNIPPHPVFDADDLFNNTHNIFNGEHYHESCVNLCDEPHDEICADVEDSCGEPGVVNICIDDETEALNNIC